MESIFYRLPVNKHVGTSSIKRPKYTERGKGEISTGGLSYHHCIGLRMFVALSFMYSTIYVLCVYGVRVAFEYFMRSFCFAK